MAETRVERREWWNVEWTANCMTCGYNSLDHAREDFSRAVWPDARIRRITQVTVTTEESVDVE